MANPKLSDSATADDCDWSFTENPAIVKALRNAAKRIASRFGVDADDLYQEAVLFLAVRPQAVAQDMANGHAGPNYVGFRASNVMQDRAEVMKRGTDSEDYPADDVWFDGNER